MMEPLLSVCLITYNHLNYIKDAIEGVLMQKVNFTWELIIADDCSTDGTREILLQYKAKYPEFIKLILQDINKGAAQNWIELITTPKSKYIAYFDGDDYWTDPLKLQKQVDFLEANEDFSICFHKVKYINAEDTTIFISNEHQQDTSTIKDLAKGNFISTVSCVFKNNFNKEFPDFLLKCPIGDYALHVYNSQFGKIKFIAEVMANYRVHNGGIWSMKLSVYQDEQLLKTINALIGNFDNEINYILSINQKELILRNIQNIELNYLPKGLFYLINENEQIVKEINFLKKIKEKKIIRFILKILKKIT